VLSLACWDILFGYNDDYSLTTEKITMTTLQHPAPTFDDVWRMFQETDQKFKETDRKFKETDRKFQESEKRFQESEKRFQETERIMKESALEVDLVLKETGLLVKQLSKNLGELGNRLGEFVEYMVAPAVVRLFQSQDIQVHEVHQSIEANRNGEGIEIDLLVVNDGVLVAVECKSKLTLEHVDQHLKRMEKLKRLLPSYQNHQALGAVAAMVMSESVKAYAHDQGLYVLYQNGDSVDIAHPDKFCAKTW
jgi:hypothetical protein